MCNAFQCPNKDHPRKLLDNVTQWTGLVAPDTLQEVVLDGLLNRYLLLSLQNSPPGLLSLRKAEAVSGLGALHNTQT